MIKKNQVENICKKLNTKLIAYKFLAKGNHNINYVLETDKEKFVLRIDNNKQFKNLKKEYKLLKSLSLGLAPKVFLFDSSRKIIEMDYLIEEFIEGIHPPNKPTDNFVITMAKWFKELHKNKRKTKPYSVKSAVKPYYNNYLKYKQYINNITLSKKLEMCINKGLKICIENNKIFSDRKLCSLLHNDSSRENIFYKKDKVKLIDWEFAGYGMPEREIVYFIDSYILSRKQIKLFLKSYGYPNTSVSRKKLYIFYLILLFSSIGYSLWSLGLTKKIKEKNNRLLKDINLLEKLLSGQMF